MEKLFIAMTLGHFVGDYLLQSKKMALGKMAPGLSGHLWCSWHCLVYSLAVALFAWRFDPLFIGLVFLSHWPIDRWKLAMLWLKAIGGRGVREAYESGDRYREIDISFSCLVYAVADNTMHLVLFWFIAMALA